MDKQALSTDQRKVIRRCKSLSKLSHGPSPAKRGVVKLVEPLGKETLAALKRQLTLQARTSKARASAAGSPRYGSRNGLVLHEFKRN